jgi:hypothetical protein
MFSPGSTTPTINGTTFSGPAFLTAERTCELFGGGPGNPPPVPEQQKRALLEFARCIRLHGLTAHPDPQFPPGGGIFGGGTDVGDNPNSPGVKHAAAICNSEARQHGGD